MKISISNICTKLIPVCFICFTLLLGACGGKDDPGDTPPDQNGKSNWDEMDWDQDKWSEQTTQIQYIKV